MESPTIMTEFKELMENFTKPQLLSRVMPTPIRVIYKNNEFILKNLYGFNTIGDLKIAIYSSELFNKEDYAAPNNQFIYIKKPKGPVVETIDFSWDAPSLTNPIRMASGADRINPNFVTSEGDRRNVGFEVYDNLLIESKLTTDTIELILFKDMHELVPGPRPISEREYNGRLYPYFPQLNNRRQYPNDDEKKQILIQYNFFTKKENYVSKINYLLNERGPISDEEGPKYAGTRYICFTWPNNKINEGLDSYFYDIDVNERRPYLRLLSSGPTPISKVYAKDLTNNTLISYIKHWSTEQNPTPEKSHVMGKIALRCTRVDVPIIYATIRLCDDGSFSTVIEPPKGIVKVNLDTDFNNITEDLVQGITDINRNNIIPSLGLTNIVYGLKLHISQVITRKQFQKRLQLFRPFFQEIDPLPKEQPYAMLRYKSVNNFITEDSISNFLTQLSNKNILKAETKVSDMIVFLSEEFQLDIETARQKVLNWVSQKDEQQIVVGETKVYVPLNNTGVDISIFQTKNLFTFHLYNIDSIITLQRILTYLYLMLSLPEEDLIVSPKDVKEYVVAEQKSLVKLSEEVENEGESNNDEDDDGSVFYDPLMQQQENDDSARSIVDDINKALKSQEEAPVVALRDVKFVEPKLAVGEDIKEKEKEKGIANFFIRKLQEVDKSLFEYPITHPSEKSYVQMCAANEMRQPAVMTHDQFQDMKDEYANDGVEFRIFPKPEEATYDDPDSHSDPNKIVTVIEYRKNYYICSELFCTRDEIVVLKKDFISTKMRKPIIEDGVEKTTKPPNTCPFCLGKLVSNRRNPGLNETVLQRKFKPSTTKAHVWINFLKKSPHPQGLPLPCCFVSPKPIEFVDTQSKLVKKKKVKKDEDEDDDEDDDSSSDIREDRPLKYLDTLRSIRKRYIVGENVIPLEVLDTTGPQIGLLPTSLNELFEQDNSNIVVRIGNPQRIIPNAKGFLRFGVENRKAFKADSFLSAIAPFFKRNSAQEMKERILEVVLPNVFIQLNYGNLMLEFYSPEGDPVSRPRLIKWAKDSLRIVYTDTNALELERIYKSYNAFRSWLFDDTAPKEYRQFALLFAQTELIQHKETSAGITFIVIDLNEDGTVKIRCPSYGYNTGIMSNNNIGFLFHHYSGIWEPLFYVNNVITGLTRLDLYTLDFQKITKASWPPIVKKIFSVFTDLCSGPGKSIYTSQSQIKTNSLLTLSEGISAISEISKQFSIFGMVGILKDSYNHIIAIVCEERRGEKPLQVILPVVDDGYLVTRERVFFNYDDLENESYMNTMRIYNKYILPVVSIRNSRYVPDRIVKNKLTQMYVAIQLKNNIYIPIEEQQTISSDLTPVTIDEFEWDINRNIIFGNEEGEYKGLKDKTIEEKGINEIYQHLRVTFGNYIAIKGDSLIDKLNDDVILNNDLTLNDKRKRLILLFGNLIQSWFTDEAIINTTPSVLIKDCIIQAENKCSDKCVWTSDSKCKIHVNEKYKNVNLSNLLMFRLFDELIRYAEKRKEIFENKISKLVFFKKAITIGDEYIVPENTLDWSNFLRGDTSHLGDESPRFHEEFSSDNEVLAEKEEDDEIFSLPEYLQEYLNINDPKTNKLQYYEITDGTSMEPILKYFSLTNVEIKYDGVTDHFEADQTRRIGQKKGAYILQINTNKEPYNLKSPATLTQGAPIYIILITPTGSGFIIKNNKKGPLHYNDLPNILLPKQQ